MKLLLDACVWGGSKSALISLGHDVIWAGDWPEDPGDDALLSRAHAEERILVTLDKDFGELAVIQARRHARLALRVARSSFYDVRRNCGVRFSRYAPLQVE